MFCFPPLRLEFLWSSTSPENRDGVDRADRLTQPNCSSSTRCWANSGEDECRGGNLGGFIVQFCSLGMWYRLYGGLEGGWLWYSLVVSSFLHGFQRLTVAFIIFISSLVRFCFDFVVFHHALHWRVYEGVVFLWCFVFIQVFAFFCVWIYVFAFLLGLLVARVFAYQKSQTTKNKKHQQQQRLRQKRKRNEKGKQHPDQVRNRIFWNSLHPPRFFTPQGSHWPSELLQRWSLGHRLLALLANSMFCCFVLFFFGLFCVVILFCLYIALCWFQVATSRFPCFFFLMGGWLFVCFCCLRMMSILVHTQYVLVMFPKMINIIIHELFSIQTIHHPFLAMYFQTKVCKFQRLLVSCLYNYVSFIYATSWIRRFR